MFLARRGFPIARFDSFRHDLDRLFNEFQTGFGELWPLDERSFPALNIWDDGERLYAEAEVPGFRMDDIEVAVMGSQLTIKGRREFSKEEGTSFHRRERRTGEFIRTLTLPVEVDPDKVEATLKDGVLAVVMPKAKAALARKIKVKTA
ncbi:MAG: Hsp20/alpha crystallin family protein [Phycisphaerae bacterium]